jgi:hypothetical protein
LVRTHKDTLAKLEQAHATYCDYNQQERSDCAAMARLGHPRARAYRQLRAFFDTLRFACNSNARHFSYVDAHEQSQYWAPHLDLTWHPAKALACFGHIYPAHNDWDRYIEAAAAADWKGAGPTLHGGSWNITTRNRELRDALLAFHDAKGAFVHDHGAGNRHAITVQLNEQSGLNNKIIALLRKHHKGYVLPKRSVEQDRVDSAPLPMAEKTFMHAKVDEVTVTERHVLVPLVPLGNSQDLVLRVAGQLVEALKQGFPFAQAEDWLRKFLQPASFRQLAAQFT